MQPSLHRPGPTRSILPVPRHRPTTAWRAICPVSNAAFSLTQIRDLFAAPDWHPNDHPAMPEIVSHGRKPGVFACGFCHLPNGLGRPENSSLAGLPAAYIAQQVADFKSGARKSSEPASLPTNLMISVAKAATDAEVQEAAAYFAALQPRPWIQVIEADMVPKTRVGGWMLIAAEPAGTEPIGNRIIEMPVNLERTELRDSTSGFIAYAPVGSIAKRRSADRHRRWPHHPVRDLPRCRAEGARPGTCARGPLTRAILFRQLFDMKHGLRNGVWSALMKAVVAPLTEEDMVAIAAYAASRQP